MASSSATRSPSDVRYDSCTCVTAMAASVAVASVSKSFYAI